MPLEVVKYGHPALRSKGKKVTTIDNSIITLAEEMIETMYHEDGCGLAAHQVGRAIQLAVLDIMPAYEYRPSRAWMNGKEIELNTIMPLVMINPEIHPVDNRKHSALEGCLSIPDLRAEVERFLSVRIVCQNIHGETLQFEADGLLAHAAQHEYDHLHGILFIDYLDAECLKKHQPLLDKLRESSCDF